MALDDVNFSRCSTPGREQHGDRHSSRSNINDSTFPTTLADITFHSSFDGNSTSNIYKTLSALRKSTLSIPNRLSSVLQDADFVEALHDHLNNHLVPHDDQARSPQSNFLRNENTTGSLGVEDKQYWPLIPNERSGSWPLNPKRKLESQQGYVSTVEGSNPPSPVSAYFKSTDGHVNQWSFSTRRLNLPVLEILGHASRSVLVDTTRRGKAYPDALRRTVPMYTAVWNHVLFEDLSESGVCDFQGFGLEKGEIAQIESRLPGFARDLRSLGLDLDGIKKKLRRPIRCVWVSQPSGRDLWTSKFDEVTASIQFEQEKWNHVGGVNILICCSASRRVLGAEMSDDGYIQGAGDDSEGWSQGLTAKVFWKHREELTKTMNSAEELEQMVKDLVRHDKQSQTGSDAVLVKPTMNLFLGTTQASIQDSQLIIDCHGVTDESTALELRLGCKEGKLGSKTLREKLPNAMNVVRGVLRNGPGAQILAKCSTGKDLSVGVVLTILCSFYDDNGENRGILYPFESWTSADTGTGAVNLSRKQAIDKQFIKQRLAWITSSKPDANPSRATLQAVNSFLMDRPI